MAAVSEDSDGALVDTIGRTKLAVLRSLAAARAGAFSTTLDSLLLDAACYLILLCRATPPGAAFTLLMSPWNVTPDLWLPLLVAEILLELLGMFSTIVPILWSGAWWW